MGQVCSGLLRHECSEHDSALDSACLIKASQVAALAPERSRRNWRQTIFRCGDGFLATYHRAEGSLWVWV
jgi:hypothetical protein